MMVAVVQNKSQVKSKVSYLVDEETNLGLLQRSSVDILHSLGTSLLIPTTRFQEKLKENKYKAPAIVCFTVSNYCKFCDFVKVAAEED